jgi:long-chain acyl-CoA synthetase
MGEIVSGERRIDITSLNERAARAAAGLRSLGIGRGDAIALYLRNDFPFFEASFAAGLLGAYPVPVNWHYTEDEARYLFENSGAKAIVIHADLLAGIRGAIPANVRVLAVPTPPEIAACYGLGPDRCTDLGGATAWDTFLGGFDPLPPQPIEPPGSMIYTSGTTGHPKGVRRHPPTPEQTLAQRAGLMRGFGFTAEEAPGIVTVVTGPMYHSAPNAYGSVAASLGAKVILQPRFEPEELLALIERHRVTHLHMVPIMFNRLLRLPEETRRRYDLSSLRFVIHAAAPVAPAVKRAMIEWWGNVINEYYGSTETGIVTFCTAEEWLAHPGTVGRPTPNAELRVLSPDGTELPTGSAGEIACRLTTVSDFTYHRDDDKRRASSRGNLFAPGDIGYLDRDGFLYLCDRAKDMLISGGVNIYPAEIEAELHKMPGVADCAVFGIPDEEYGEAVCAVVEPQPGIELTDGEVKSYLRRHVAGFKVPKRVDFLNKLPREDSGKIFKRKLREPYWAGLDRRI